MRNIVQIFARNSFGTKSLLKKLNLKGFHSRAVSSSKVADEYDEVHRRSINDPEEFWGEAAKGVHWFEPFEKVLDNSNPPFTKWFVGGKLNASYNALDRHVLAGRGDRTAIVYDSPITGAKAKLTYRETKERVARLAGALVSLGVKKGDVVLIYMPMVPDTIVGMLATARIGAIHNVVFGGFAAPQLAVRMTHSKAKVVLCASVGIEPSRVVHYKPILDEAIDLSSHKPRHCVVLRREGFDHPSLTKGRDFDWEELEAKSSPHDPIPVDSEDPAYVLYTSGTTGSPKGVVRPTGGHTVVLPYTMRAIYDVGPDDVWWSPSDFGWVVGHSYVCYAPLLNGNTTIIYEGKPTGTPDELQYFRVIREYNVRSFFITPTALRAIARELASTENQLEGTKFQHLFVAGEPFDIETYNWASKVFGTVPLNHWWQTETGFPITAQCLGINMIKNPPRGTTGKPFMGFDVRVLNREGHEARPGELGRIVCKLPLPPCNFSTLLNADDQFEETYFHKFPGFYDTMDAGTKDLEGYISIQARDDDVINVSGHRLSTLAIEEAILSHQDIIETAVIGVSDKLKGEIPFGFLVVKEECTKTEEQVRKEVVKIVREKIGPVVSFQLCALVKDIPKTRSGKIPRKSFSELAKDKNIVISPVIEDATHYTFIIEALNKWGYATKVSIHF